MESLSIGLSLMILTLYSFKRNGVFLSISLVFTLFISNSVFIMAQSVATMPFSSLLFDSILDNLNSFDKNIERKHRNLEMEAQAERAYGGFLLKYRKLKNGVVRYYIFLFMAVAMLAGGLYLDGSIDLTKESLQKQVSIVMTKGGKKDTHKKKNDNADTIYVVSVSNARLRTGPGTSYETLNGYDNGSEVVLTGEKQSDGSHIWYKVTAEDGTVGWMRSDMIKESK